MTPAEMPTCEACGARYVSPLAAALCCDPDHDDDPFVRMYD